MDSLLSNAQRCGRKADALVKFGLFDEALIQLDRAVELLNELKTVNTRYENIQLIKVQIDSVDRKMRTVAIKRAESLKKKLKIESLISRNRSEAQAPVIIEHNAFKLHKDEKALIEELATTNSEYRKVNTFLINEIELLKRENEQLKVELLKMHMNNSSLTMSSSSTASEAAASASASATATTTTESSASASISAASEAAVRNIYDKYNLHTADSSLSLSDRDDDESSSGCGDHSACKQESTEQQLMLGNGQPVSFVCQSTSAGLGKASAMSVPVPAGAHEVMVCNARNSNRIDLSKYIDNDESDEETDEDSDDSHNAPLEFTIDS